MPFKSKSQRRFMHWAESVGKIKEGTSSEWEKETKDKDLPERKKALSKLRKKHG